MLLALCILACFAGPGAANAEDATLYVFVQTGIRPNKLEKLLNSSMTGVKTTVFGRVRDFQKNLRKSPPDAVLALRPVLEQNALTVTLQGTSGGADAELYVLMSVDEQITPQQLADKVVGTVDLLGRKKMGKFVSVLFNTGGAKLKLKRVTKVGDLLPLLQFKAADVVLIPESKVDSVMKSSQLNLRKTKVEGARVGLPAVAILNPAAKAQIVAAVQGLSGSINTKIGVQKWTAK